MKVSDKINHNANRLEEIGIRPDTVKMNSEDYQRLVSEMQVFAGFYGRYTDNREPDMSQHSEYRGMKIVINDALEDGSIVVEGNH